MVFESLDSIHDLSFLFLSVNASYVFLHQDDVMHKYDSVCLSCDVIFMVL